MHRRSPPREPQPDTQRPSPHRGQSRRSGEASPTRQYAGVNLLNLAFGMGPRRPKAKSLNGLKTKDQRPRTEDRRPKTQPSGRRRKSSALGRRSHAPSKSAAVGARAGCVKTPPATPLASHRRRKAYPGRAKETPASPFGQRCSAREAQWHWSQTFPGPKDIAFAGAGTRRASHNSPQSTPS